jgi:hypothetical protein
MTRLWPSDEVDRETWPQMTVLITADPEAVGSTPALSTLAPLRSEDVSQVVGAG